jgi:hypothetical protein
VEYCVFKALIQMFIMSKYINMYNYLAIECMYIPILLHFIVY